MKSFLLGFFLCLALVLYVCGFCYFMDKAIMGPIEKNAFHPIYSIWWIAAWIGYICLGAGVAFVVRFGSES